MSYRGVFLALGAAALLSGCNGGVTPPGAAPGPVATPVVPRPSIAPKEPDAGPPLPPSSYDAKQRRDPFLPLTIATGGTKGLTVSTVKLVGVILGGPGASVGLVEAPDGIGYILKVGDVLGDGRVASIGKDTISFSVPGRPGQPPSTVTLRLRTD
jgi:hypothetical protein